MQPFATCHGTPHCYSFSALDNQSILRLGPNSELVLRQNDQCLVFFYHIPKCFAFIVPSLENGEEMDFFPAISFSLTHTYVPSIVFVYSLSFASVHQVCFCASRIHWPSSLEHISRALHLSSIFYGISPTTTFAISSASALLFTSLFPFCSLIFAQNCSLVNEQSINRYTSTICFPARLEEPCL